MTMTQAASIGASRMRARTNNRLSDDKPPYLWHVSPVIREYEKRQLGRRSLHCRFTMTPHREQDDPHLEIAGECMNISNAGMYGLIPTNHDLSAGQRCHFQFEIDERGPEPGAVQIVRQVGRILRVDLLIDGRGETNLIGVAVRLVGNREGVVPMPY